MKLVEQKIEILEKTTSQKADVQILDLFDENNNPSGTRVELKIRMTL